jgi:hypothetical protein
MLYEDDPEVRPQVAIHITSMTKDTTLKSDRFAPSITIIDRVEASRNSVNQNGPKRKLCHRDSYASQHWAERKDQERPEEIQLVSSRSLPWRLWCFTSRRTPSSLKPRLCRETSSYPTQRTHLSHLVITHHHEEVYHQGRQITSGAIHPAIGSSEPVVWYRNRWTPA